MLIRADRRSRSPEAPSPGGCGRVAAAAARLARLKRRSRLRRLASGCGRDRIASDASAWQRARAHLATTARAHQARPNSFRYFGMKSSRPLMAAVSHAPTTGPLRVNGNTAAPELLPGGIRMGGVAGSPRRVLFSLQRQHASPAPAGRKAGVSLSGDRRTLRIRRRPAPPWMIGPRWWCSAAGRGGRVPANEREVEH